MRHNDIIPGEVYEFAPLVAYLATGHDAPPYAYANRPCMVKSKSPNRMVGITFANDPMIYRTSGGNLEPIEGRKYRQWPPEHEPEMNDDNQTPEQ